LPETIFCLSAVSNVPYKNENRIYYKLLRHDYRVASRERTRIFTAPSWVPSSIFSRV
jgi:hypothetical protein